MTLGQKMNIEEMLQQTNKMIPPPEPLFYAEINGGPWFKWYQNIPNIRIHTIVFSDGWAWDSSIGWTKRIDFNTISIMAKAFKQL